MIVEVIIFFAFTLLLYVKLNQKRQGLPPGEWGLPLIGCLPPKGEKFNPYINSLREKHGNQFIVKLGARLALFLCDYETIKDAFSKLSGSGRPSMFSFNIISGGKNSGLAMSEGHAWLSNRRFALRVLKDFGLGRSSLEDTINVETESIIKYLKTKTDKPVEIGWNLNVAILNVLWGIVAGMRFDIEDDAILKFSQILSEDITTREGPMQLLDYYPWLVPLVPKLIKDHWMKVNKLERNRDELHEFFLKVIKDSEKTLDKENPRHYIDMYLIERKLQEANTEFDFRSSVYTDLCYTLSNLFAAGSDTTSATTKWLILYMVKYPQIQEKVQKEIDSVVPRSRFPQLQDKESLPYLEAVIHDLQRVVSLLPANFPHETTEDVIIGGHNIPKGTMLFACTEVVHKDKKYWEKPDQFFPEHFLDEEGKFKMAKKGFMPFSLGKRHCLGESLAKMELFLFISALLQNFNISEPEDQPVTLKPDTFISLLNYPRDQKINFRIRN